MCACSSEETKLLQKSSRSLAAIFARQAKTFALKQQTCYKEAVIGDQKTHKYVQADSAQWMRQWNHIHLLNLQKLSMHYDSSTTKKDQLMWKTYETSSHTHPKKRLSLSVAYDSLEHLRHMEGLFEEKRHLYVRHAVLGATFVSSLADEHLLRYTWKGYQKVWGRDTLFYTFSWYCPLEDLE